MQCPAHVTTYAEQYRAKEETATTVVAVVSSVLVCGYLSVLFFRPSTTHSSPAENSIAYLFRVNVLRLLLGIASLSLSFSFLSSALSVASSGLALAALRDVQTAVDISHGRLQSSCSHPLRAANLGVAAAFFSLFDLVVFGVLDFVIVPDLWPTLTSSQKAYDEYYYSASFARAR